MQSLEELDAELEARRSFKSSENIEQMRNYLTARQFELDYEDRSLSQGWCPKCPYPVEFSQSEHGTRFIYYSCKNPDKMMGHIFIRFEPL